MGSIMTAIRNDHKDYIRDCKNVGVDWKDIGDNFYNHWGEVKRMKIEREDAVTTKIASYIYRRLLATIGEPANDIDGEEFIEMAKDIIEEVKQ